MWLVNLWVESWSPYIGFSVHPLGDWLFLSQQPLAACTYWSRGFFSTPLLRCFLGHGGSECVTAVSVLSTWSHNLSIVTTCASLHWLVPTAKKKLLWPRMKAAYVYGCKHKYLDDSSTAWPFSNMTTAASNLSTIGIASRDYISMITVPDTK